jgi:hypothetical protein
MSDLDHSVWWSSVLFDGNGSLADQIEERNGLVSRVAYIVIVPRILVMKLKYLT